MSTLYPGSSDTFNVPASPSTTPLSSSGTGTRNHVSHHRDMGDAITAIQNNVTQLTHTHSGVGLNGNKLIQANTHNSPDTDASTVALHHTLGTGANQAASGAHNHDTRYIRLDGSVDQVITGKKTFPSGSSSIAIPDHQNAIHHHLNTTTDGGAAYSPIAQTQWNRGGFGGHAVEDDYIHNNRFSLPAFVTLTGNIYISYYIDYNTGAPGAQGGSDTGHDAFFYFSYNQGESPAFSAVRNLIPNGENFGGQMYQGKHTFQNNGNADAMRMHLSVPLVLNASVSDRNNLAIVTRISNNTNGWLKELNYYIELRFSSQNFIAL